MKALKAYNVQIWCGLKECYSDNKIHTIDEVRRICDEHVKIGDCVTITKTEFRYTNGNEKGFVIGYIQYPRFPRSRKMIRKRAFKLAKKLMIALKQYKVTVTTPFKSYMFENDNQNNFEKIEVRGLFSFLVKLHRPSIEKRP